LCHDCPAAADVFQPSVAWQGLRPGFVFTTGEHGTGYYKDTRPTPAPAAAGAPAATAVPAPKAAQPAPAAAGAAPAAGKAAAQPASQRTQVQRQDSGVSAASAANPAAAAAAAAQRRAAQQQQQQQARVQAQQQQQQPSRRPALQTPKVSVAPVKPQLTAYGQEVCCLPCFWPALQMQQRVRTLGWSLSL